ncbi:MAG TPA: hypothetical protein VN605_11815 [Thermoanaerobaculia bacterium]|nr:hypothetical protein [Thermoanaerobaculia bacterium]
MALVESFASLRDRTAELIEFLVANGIRVHPSSRLPQYLKQLNAAAKVDGVTVPKELDLAIWHRCLIEVDDLNLVARSLSAAPEVAGWKDAVSCALRGGVVRTDEIKHSPARDIQFELIIASMFRRAAYQVELAEPDVVLTSETPPIGVAAKRPRSLNNLDNIIGDADKQIARSGLHGILALDLSLVVAPTDAHISTTDFHEAFKRVKEIANGFILRNGDHVRSLVDASHTFGLIAHVAVPIFDAVTPRLAYGRRWAISNLCALDDARTATLRAMAERLGEAEGVED